MQGSLVPSRAKPSVTLGKLRVKGDWLLDASGSKFSGTLPDGLADFSFDGEPVLIRFWRGRRVVVKGMGYYDCVYYPSGRVSGSIHWAGPIEVRR